MQVEKKIQPLHEKTHRRMESVESYLCILASHLSMNEGKQSTSGTDKNVYKMS